jgi:hypothetical protein
MNVDNRDNKCTIYARVITRDSSKESILHSINNIPGIDNYSYALSV